MVGLKGRPAQYFVRASEILRRVVALRCFPVFAAAIRSRCCCGISLRQIRCAIVVEVYMVIITGITRIADISGITHITRMINIVHFEKIEIQGEFFASICSGCCYGWPYGVG